MLLLLLKGLERWLPADAMVRGRNVVADVRKLRFLVLLLLSLADFSSDILETIHQCSLLGILGRCAWRLLFERFFILGCS